MSSIFSSIISVFASSVCKDDAIARLRENTHHAYERQIVAIIGQKFDVPSRMPLNRVQETSPPVRRIDPQSGVFQRKTSIGFGKISGIYQKQISIFRSAVGILKTLYQKKFEADFDHSIYQSHPIIHFFFQLERRWWGPLSGREKRSARTFSFSQTGMNFAKTPLPPTPSPTASAYSHAKSTPMLSSSRFRSGVFQKLFQKHHFLMYCLTSLQLECGAGRVRFDTPKAT